MMRAVAYVRVSTKDQAENGVSLKDQKAKIQAMCVVRGDELIDIIEDEESGKDLNRPGFQQIQRMVEAHEVDVVIICKLDRLTRSVGDLAHLLSLFDKHGVALVSLAESLDTQSAAGRLVINVMGAVAQWEREVISERTKAALAYKKSKGQRVGNIPFGFKMGEGKNLIQDVGEQTIIRLIVNTRANDQMSYRGIAAALNFNGYRTRTGGKWRHESVEDVFKANQIKARIA
jgi:DNA invertase Pin-like site-specific DNA recombinase